MDSKQQKVINPLGYAPIGALLLRFALPSVVGMLVNAIYNIVDQIFIGRGVGYLGNAATTIAFPIVTIILAVSTLLGAGGSAYAALKLGEHDEEAAEQTCGNHHQRRQNHPVRAEQDQRRNCADQAHQRRNRSNR